MSTNVTRIPKRGRPRAANKKPLGIHSVETALDIFQCVIDSEGGISLTSLSRRTGLQPSKLHRYLVSLVNYGLLSQTDVTGLYDLGAGARRVGLAALSRFDEMRPINDAMRSFALEQDCTLCHYVWTELGPTLVNIEFGNFRLPVTLRVGSWLPLSGSATGLVFLAYMPKSTTEALLAREKAAAKAAGVKIRSDKQIDDELRKIRSSLIYKTTETILPNVAYAAVGPLFDREERLFSAIIAIPQLQPGDAAASDNFMSRFEALISNLSINILGRDADAKTQRLHQLDKA